MTTCSTVKVCIAGVNYTANVTYSGNGTRFLTAYNQATGAPFLVTGAYLEGECPTAPFVNPVEGFALRAAATQPVTPANTFVNVNFTNVNVATGITSVVGINPFTVTQTGTYLVEFAVSHDDNGVASGCNAQSRIVIAGTAVGVATTDDIPTGARRSQFVAYKGVITAGQTIGAQVNHSTINGNTINNATLMVSRVA